MKDLGELMKQAQAMQEKLQDAQAKLAESSVEGTSRRRPGAPHPEGLGRAGWPGHRGEPVAPGEGEILADLIVAAHADAKRKLDQAQADVMREVAGPLAGLPGMPEVVKSASAGPEIERLIALLAKLPGLGPRSARRAALTLLKKREQLLAPLSAALADAAERVKVCETCGSLDTTDPCAICADPGRDGALICVVEEVGALWAMERAGAFRGRYHVLGGLLSALDGVGPRRPAHRRPCRPAPPTRGCARWSWPCRPPSTARPPPTIWPTASPAPGSQVTMLARGVPVGGDLDWLDDGTIAQAMRARRPA